MLSSNNFLYEKRRTSFELNSHGPSIDISPKWKNTIIDLPKEILFQIFSFLDPHFLVTKVRLVCKAWNDLVSSNSFWKSLRALSLEEEKGGTIFIEAIVRKCPNLQYLKVSGSHIKKVSPLHIPISSLPHLKTLCFDHLCPSCDKALQNILMSCPLLSSLSLIDDYKPLNEKVVEMISKVEGLISLDISRLYILDDEKVLIKVFQNCQLKHLNISVPENLNEEVVECLFSHCSNTLTSLSLFNSFPEKSFKNIVNCSKLTVLKIGCSELSDKSLNYLKKLPMIQTLALEDGKHFSSASLRELFHRNILPHLRNLAVINCKWFENSTLELIANNFTDLKSLKVEYCSKVTDKGIHHVMTKCYQLEVLRLSELSVRYTFLQELHHHLPRLRLLILLDRNIDVDVVRKFVKLHPVFKAEKYMEISDMGFYTLYARCLDDQVLKPSVVFMDKDGYISAFDPYS